LAFLTFLTAAFFDVVDFWAGDLSEPLARVVLALAVMEDFVEVFGAVAFLDLVDVFLLVDPFGFLDFSSVELLEVGSADTAFVASDLEGYLSV
jgi:hypothetical protein